MDMYCKRCKCVTDKNHLIKQYGEVVCPICNKNDKFKEIVIVPDDSLFKAHYEFKEHSKD